MPVTTTLGSKSEGGEERKKKIERQEGRGRKTCSRFYEIKAQSSLKVTRFTQKD